VCEKSKTWFCKKKKVLAFGCLSKNENENCSYVFISGKKQNTIFFVQIFSRPVHEENFSTIEVELVLDF